MPSLPLTIGSYLSPLGHQILQEGSWLLLIQTTLKILGILLFGINQWLMTRDFKNVLNTTTQLFMHVIKNISFMIGIWGSLLWGAFRILNREDMLLQLTTLQLILLVLSSAIILIMNVAIAIEFNEQIDIEAQEDLIQQASNPYIDAQFDFDSLSSLAKRSVKLISVLALLMSVLHASFLITRFLALSQGVLQTGYALLYLI